MFKKIILTGVLLGGIFVAHAKNVFLPTGIHSNAGITSVNDPLVVKIAADNDAKKYYSSNVAFANKVLETRSGALLLKYIQKTITPAEKADLFAKLGMNQEELNALGKKLGHEAQAFMSKYPEMKQISEKKQKEILLDAFRKISIDPSMQVRFSKAKIITYEQCFFEWMACTGLCAITCSYSENYGNCMLECSIACAGTYGLCWFLAE